jgi:hypothetical protein
VTLEYGHNIWDAGPSVTEPLAASARDRPDSKVLERLSSALCQGHAAAMSEL